MISHSNNQQTTAYNHENENGNKSQGSLESMKIERNGDTNGVLSLCDDILIDMKYLVNHSGLSDKLFYSLIKKGRFPKPIKLGRASRWRQSEYEQWLADRERQR